MRVHATGLILTSWIAAAALAQTEQPALVVGKVSWPGHDLTSAKVELFADAKCTKRVAESQQVGEQGTYAVAVRPGRYFARLWVDDNGNGRLDAGDGVGYYGITDPQGLGKPPEPISLQRGQVVTDVGIAVVGTIGADGKPRPLGASGEAIPDVIIAGKVLWPGHAVGGARVDLCRDDRFRDVAFRSPPVEEGGSFAVMVTPGTYYARVVVDANGNGRADAGDGIGFYGVEDMTDPEDRPLPLVVEGEDFAVQVKIPVSAVIKKGGGLEAVQTPASLGPASRKATAAIRGRLVSDASRFELAWVLCAAPNSWWKVGGAARPDPSTGEFEVAVAPGKWALLAVVDADENGRFDTGDVVGLLGVDDFADSKARPTVVELRDDSTVEGLQVAIRGRVIDGGNVVPMEGDVPDEAADVNIQPSEMPGILEGRVVWPNGRIRGGTVNVFRDPALLDHVATVDCARETGRFVLALPAGEYYLMAGVDADGDGRVSPGDGIGMYGADDLLGGAKKRPLRVDSGALVTHVRIVVSARFDRNLAPVPIEKEPPGAAAPGRAEEPG
ncbi:MAG: hypothetical protein ACE5O2_00605 [Armatimonadota bacterium]